jgi:hypothetical protein
MTDLGDTLGSVLRNDGVALGRRAATLRPDAAGEVSQATRAADSSDDRSALTSCCGNSTAIGISPTTSKWRHSNDRVMLVGIRSSGER